MTVRVRALFPFLIAAAAIFILPVTAFVSCCCAHRAGRQMVRETLPSVGFAQFEVPREAEASRVTHTEMRNVDFRLDRGVILHIHEVHGEMFDRSRHAPLNFDDKNSFIFRITSGEIGIDGPSLSELMNRYVFAYPGAPLKNLDIRVEGDHLRQSGVMHKIIDIPFNMLAQVSLTPDGWIRVHPTEIEICSLDGKALMKAFGLSLEEIIDVKQARGIRVEKNDLIIDPIAILPPPAVEGSVAAVRLEGGEVVQTWASGQPPVPLEVPFSSEPNYMYFRDGTLRMGKLFMVRADMQVVDSDPTDPFDFFLNYYNNQLAAGYTDNLPNYGLRVVMRDFSDLGTPPRSGERLPPSRHPGPDIRG